MKLSTALGAASGNKRISTFPLFVFGHVLEGMDVVEAISKTERDGNDKPLEDVIIETVEIEEK